MAMQPQVKLTLDEFEAFIALPENEDRLWELIDGEPIEKVPTEEHNLIGGNLFAALRAFVKAHGLGRVLYETRHTTSQDKSNSRIPDVEFTRAERLQPVVTTGAVKQLPDLAIEIKSPSDSYAKMRRTAAYYLDHGVQVVWLVYPAKRQVEIWTNDDPVQTLRVDEVLSGGDLLPGFILPVSEIFAE